MGNDASTETVIDCFEIQSSCPTAIPHPSGRCEEGLSCEYQNNDVRWTYACEQGRWTASGDCGQLLGCSAVPPLAERCSNPLTVQNSATQISIGPVNLSESFRSFRSDENIELIWGPQGSPMFEYRVQLSGDQVDDIDCVNFEARLKVDGQADSLSKAGLRVRCGDSLRIYSIVDSPAVCDQREIDLEIEVSITGIGTSTASVKFQGGNCFG